MATDTKSPSRVERWARDPASFFAEVLRARLYPKQVEILEAVRDNPRVSVKGCNGSGKDFVAGRLIAWWLSTHHPAVAIVIGPTQRQVKDIVWGELASGYTAAESAATPYSLGGRMLTQEWRVSPNHYALGFSTDQPFNIQGFHSPNLLVLITEAHGMDQGHVEAIKRLQPKRLLMTGNPLSLSGEFFDSFHSKADLWETITITAEDTPNVQAGKEFIPGLITSQWVKDRAEDWGEDSAMYIASVLGEFPDSLTDGIVPLSAVKAAASRQATGEGPVIVACDVARSGADKTVVIRRQGNVARIIHRVQGADLMSTAGFLADYVANHVVDYLVVDEVGIGAGVVDRLRELGVKQLFPFSGGQSPSPQNRERFVNRIAEAWWDVREWLVEDREADIDDDVALIAQLSSRRFEIQSDRKTRLEPKEKLPKSPDEADALAMASWAYQRYVGGPRWNQTGDGIGGFYLGETTEDRFTQVKQNLRNQREGNMAIPPPEILVRSHRDHEYTEPGSRDLYRFQEGDEKWVPEHVGELLLRAHPSKFEAVDTRNQPQAAPAEPLEPLEERPPVLITLRWLSLALGKYRSPDGNVKYLHEDSELELPEAEAMELLRAFKGQIREISRRNIANTEVPV